MSARARQSRLLLAVCLATGLLVIGCARQDRFATVNGVVLDQSKTRAHAVVSVQDPETGSPAKRLPGSAFKVLVDGQRIQPTVEPIKTLSNPTVTVGATETPTSYWVSFPVANTGRILAFSVQINTPNAYAEGSYNPGEGSPLKYFAWILSALVLSVTAFVILVGRRTLGLGFLNRPALKSSPAATGTAGQASVAASPVDLDGSAKVLLVADNSITHLTLNKATLFGTSNSAGQNLLAIKASCILGSQNQGGGLPVVVLQDPNVEATHARLEIKGDRCRIFNLATMDPVRVSGVIVPSEGLTLRPDDTVLLGALRFRVGFPQAGQG